jgi:hypothetical protein
MSNDTPERLDLQQWRLRRGALSSSAAVVAYGLSSRDVLAIEEAVGAAPAVVSSWASVLHAVRADQPACFVFALPDGNDHRGWEFLETVRTVRPFLSLACVVPATSDGYEGIYRLGVIGNVELVPATPAPTIASWERALRSTSLKAHAERILDLARLPMPSEFEVLMRRAIRLSFRPAKLPDFAEACQLHERSLRKYCTRYRYPEPQRILLWARLLTSAYFVERFAMDLSDVAQLLGFASADALRKLIRRTLGTTVRAAAGGGFFGAVCGEVRKGLPGGGEEERTPLRLVR